MVVGDGVSASRVNNHILLSAVLDLSVITKSVVTEGE